jgi:hypothetical protein
MKKIISCAVLCAFFIFSCNEDTFIEKENTNDFLGLSSQQMEAASVSQIKKLTSKDKAYMNISSELREKVSSNLKNGRSKILEFGDYYLITGKEGKKIEILRIEGSNSEQQYAFKVDGEYLLVDFLINNVVTQGAPNFNFIVSDIDGSPITNAVKSNARIEPTWWNCVTNQFHNMCMTSIWRTIMCEAAGLAAPELGLVVYASWMIHCID